MLELEDAVARILTALPAPASEVVPLSRAYGRILSAPVDASVDLPLFDNSAMDGYAVRAEDVADASAASPVRLRVNGRIAAGDRFEGEVAAGECVRLFTGSPLPHGADAVVMQEDTRVEPEQPACVTILDSVKPRENVRFRGEDVRSGTTIADAGEWLSAGRLALMAATGMSEVAVGRRPLISLLATGSELKDAGQTLLPGQIYESNRVALAPLVSSAGGVPRIFPIVRDTPDATRTALGQAMAECDVVITSGGVSVGEMDFVKSAFEELGGVLQFWRVAIKPGKPFAFGQAGDKLLFGLPGNPVSALVTFLLLARPALLKWQGALNVALPSRPGVLAEALTNPGGRRHFVRVSVDPTGHVRSAGTQASHRLGSLAAANGLLDMPPDASWPEGTAVRVLCWE